MHDFTHHVRGRRLVLSADEAFGFYATTVLGYFADLVDQWRDGMTVRVGWALFRLAYDAEGDGARIQSPTYGTSPELTFTDDCSLGLWVQAGQAATLLKANVDPLDCGYDDRIIYHHDALAFVDRGGSGSDLRLLAGTVVIRTDRDRHGPRMLANHMLHGREILACEAAMGDNNDSDNHGGPP